MIKLENTSVYGCEEAIRGMRNPLNSWERSDTSFTRQDNGRREIHVGQNDYGLMMRLAKAGPVHAKYRRMITVYVDVTAPLYWWKEFDTYKVGTVANSCSTMHKIQAKEFVLDDFSHEHLDARCVKVLEDTIKTLNDYRNWYLNYNPDKLGIPGCPSKKDIWWQMIQLLPSSYNQRRTVMFNYEVLSNIYASRKDHKLDEWHDFCHWIEHLPLSELITLQED